ncbi:MAG: thioredoxin-disulfide reductase [Clostridia bacterium]|nr:thioredoxin-disulfide reductase [Clostridia bacterium]
MEKIRDMLIIGGGPGGYTAALYGARAGLDTLLLEKMSPGGQMALTHQIDNYPGFAEGIDGFTLGMQMQQGAERFGAKTEMTEVLSADLSGTVKRVETTSGVYHARTVVLSTGAVPRPLGLPGENDWLGQGIHYCAACDGMFYRGKTVVVVGGGNTAAADALLLSRLARKVILVHRRDTLRATKIYHAPLFAADNVEFFWNSSVSALLGDDSFRGVMLQNLLTGEETRLDCDGVFVSIGRNPASGLFAGQVELDKDGYIVADESTKTNLPGVYAVGDVRTKQLRQIVTAVADGASAAFQAEEYLAEQSVSAD